MRAHLSDSSTSAVTGAKVRLICFPGAGGSGQLFKAWQALVGPTIQVWPADLPGRGGRRAETMPVNMDQLVEKTIDGLVPYLFDKPLGLLGHSFGALVAYEIAHALRRRYQRSPRFLIACAARAPHLAHLTPKLSGLDDDDLLRRIGGGQDVVPGDVGHELLRIRLPIIRQDLAVSDAYAYAPRQALSIPIMAFGGILDAAIDHASLQGWREHTSAEFGLTMFSGGHYFVQSEAERVANEIGRIVATTSPST